jgi:hypothetical protein
LRLFATSGIKINTKSGKILMKIRLFSFENDLVYQQLSLWWKFWGWKKVPPPKMFPKTGIMVENNGQEICSCFLYKTDSAWCILNWFLMNPLAKKENRKGCLDFLIQEATKIAESMGFNAIDVMIDKERIIKKLKEHGFDLTENITRVVKIL